MSEETGVRFLMDEENQAQNFVYLSPNVSNSNIYQAHNATIGVKFAQKRVILDDWWLIGGSRWSRFKFRIKHPIVYSKRGLSQLYHKIKRRFVKPKMIQPLERKN